MAVALVCFLVAASLALLGSYRDVRRVNENVADIVVRQLQVQLFLIDTRIDVSARFPDWDLVGALVQSAGQCIQYLETRRKHRAIELRRFQSRQRYPAGLVFRPGQWTPRRARRRCASHFLSREILRNCCSSPPSRPPFWPRSGTMFRGCSSLTAMVVIAICVLQFVAISRALRPTKDILAGLDKLAQGDLSCRLPRFRLIELQRISEVFNTLAASLDRTTRETNGAGRPARRRPGTRASPIWRASFTMNSHKP